jgi:NAD(P) transhydrogenase
MVVVGGGVIGCEYACMFAALGVSVTVIERSERLVGFMDDEICAVLQSRMEAMGATVLVRDSVAGVDASGEELVVQLQSGREVTAGIMLVSSGRCGNVERLNLPAAGVAVGERGRVKVNEHYRTNVEHIYAAGDLIGSPALASTSMEQARAAMCHAFDLTYREASVSPVLPYGIYTIPECSMAGTTEEDLVAKKVPYIVGRASYAQNARGQIIGDREGFLKLLFHEPDMKLLGVHMIGEGATELIHVGLTALLADATVDLFIRACYNYPTLTELYKYAAYHALGQKAARLRERGG